MTRPVGSRQSLNWFGTESSYLQISSFGFCIFHTWFLFSPVKCVYGFYKYLTLRKGFVNKSWNSNLVLKPATPPPLQSSIQPRSRPACPSQQSHTAMLQKLCKADVTRGMNVGISVMWSSLRLFHEVTRISTLVFYLYLFSGLTLPQSPYWRAKPFGKADFPVIHILIERINDPCSLVHSLNVSVCYNHSDYSFGDDTNLPHLCFICYWDTPTAFDLSRPSL